MGMRLTIRQQVMLWRVFAEQSDVCHLNCHSVVPSGECRRNGTLLCTRTVSPFVSEAY